MTTPDADAVDGASVHTGGELAETGVSSSAVLAGAAGLLAAVGLTLLGLRSRARKGKAQG